MKLLGHQIYFYLANEDFDKLQILAKKSRLSYSALVRTIVVKELEATQ